MKIFNQNLLYVSLATLALTGCGSSDNNDGASDDHDHEHESSILVSQTGTTALSLLEDGELEFVGDALGNSVVDAPITLVLSETGSYAAVLNVSSTTVSFVHGLHEEEAEGEHEEEAHVMDFSLPASQVITTNGHFSVLDSGSSVFVSYDELETITNASESTSGLSVVETYPALILDEEHELKLLFDGTDALIYEGTSQEFSFPCANPTSHAQAHEVIVMTCGAGVTALVVEENEAEEHTFTTETLTLDGAVANYVWRAKGEVIVGFEADTTNYAIVELDETTGEVQLVKGSESDAFTFTNNICDVQFESESQDILVIASGGQFVALNHEGGELKAITLDESAQSTCDDFVMAAASKAAIVVDNNVQQGYEIDVDNVEANPNGYHVHERFALTVSDVQNMVIFHEIEVGEHEH